VRPSPRIREFWAELKRRKVVRVGIAYAVAAGAIIQVADPVAAAVNLPSWTLTAVVVLAAAGLPIALGLSWAFELVREAPAPPPAPEATGQLDSSVEPAAGRGTDGAPAPAVYRLPEPVTPLIGRESELAEALRLLGGADCRILTITGPGGVGKTRLALEVAAAARPTFEQGACFVELAGIDSPDALPAVLADALAFELSGGEPTAAQLAGFLREKSLLILLDNVEQLVEGAGFLAELVRRAPAVRVIATSRQRLRLTAETVFPLDGLSLPDGEDALEESAAARLFAEFARRADPRFAPAAEQAGAIARICRAVDGIPLALELAAASVAVLPCAEIAVELEQNREALPAARDLPERHRSLSAAFESSWHLLDESERRAFSRLSVFRSGFDRSAAEAVADAGLQVLARLVEASLVQRGESGFRMLDVLRQFGQEKLEADAAAAAEVRARHSHHYLRELAGLAAMPHGPERDAAIARLGERTADVRAAWSRAVAAAEHQALRQGAHGLFLLLHARGGGAEAVEAFGRAVAAVRLRASGGGEDADAAASTLARLATRQAAFLLDGGGASEAAGLLDEVLPRLRAEQDRAEIAFALRSQCELARATGDYRSPVFEECLALARELGDPQGIGWALTALGGARQMVGEYDAARSRYREALETYRRHGLESELWKPANNLAGIAQIEGDLPLARRILEDELDASRRRGNPRSLSFLLSNLGYIAARMGDHAAAEATLAESVALARAMGFRARLAYSLNALAVLRLDRGEIAAAAATFRDALGVAVEAEETPLVPEILVGMARLQLKAGHPDRAAALLHAVVEHPPCDEETRSGARALLSDLDDGATTAGEYRFDDAVQAVLGQDDASFGSQVLTSQ
jgi:predicted ATPase